MAEELKEGLDYPIEVNGVKWRVHVEQKLRQDDGTPLWVTFVVSQTHALEEPSRYLTCTFNWDGSAEFSFSQLHFTGKASIEEHNCLMIALHQLAGRALGGQLES